MPRLRKIIKKSGKRLLRGVGDFQGSQSTVGATPILENRHFPWLADLEASFAPIRAELDAVLDHRDDIPSFHEISPDQARISKGDNWKTFAFYVYGNRIDDNCARCPATTAAIEAIPGLQNAWYSILAPRYRIPPHRGPTRSVVRCHLGLVIPADGDNCWIRVDEDVRRWHEGECLVFDDTFEHEVQNNTDEARVVLFIDFDRPMRLPGRVLSKALIAAIKASPYVRDPLKNLAARRSDPQ